MHDIAIKNQVTTPLSIESFSLGLEKAVSVLIGHAQTTKGNSATSDEDIRRRQQEQKKTPFPFNLTVIGTISILLSIHSNLILL